MHKRYVVLLATALAAMLVTVDFTIVNTCLPQIQHSLQALSTSMQWIMSGFGIAFCALLMVAGRISDTLGHHKMFYAGAILFLASSLAAGLSTSLPMLVAMRFLQGVGGAAIFPSSMAIAQGQFSPENQGRILGLFGSVLGIGFAIGPVLGSIITAVTTWRWIFFINIPTLIVCFLLAIPNIKPSVLAPSSRINLFSVLLLIIAMLGLLFYLNEGAVYGWANHWLALALVVGLLATWLLYRIESNASVPLLPYKFFRHPNFIVGELYFIISVSTSYAVVFICPLYLHTLLNYSSQHIGYMLSIMTVATVVVPGITGYLLHHYRRNLVIHVGFFVNVVSLMLLAQLAMHSGWWFIALSFLLYGVSWGTGNAIPIPVALSGNQKNAGALSGAVISVGNVVGVLLLTLGNLCLWNLQHWYFLRHLTAQPLLASGSAAQHRWLALLAKPDGLHKLLSFFPVAQQSKVQSLFYQSFAFGLHSSFVFLALCSALCWIVACFYMPKLRA